MEVKTHQVVELKIHLPTQNASVFSIAIVTYDTAEKPHITKSPQI